MFDGNCLYEGGTVAGVPNGYGMEGESHWGFMIKVGCFAVKVSF
jgi:hypothetical protein